MTSPIKPPERPIAAITNAVPIETDKVLDLQKIIKQSQSNPSTPSSLSEIGGECREAYRTLGIKDLTASCITLSMPIMTTLIKAAPIILLGELVKATAADIVIGAFGIAMQTPEESDGQP